VKDHEEHGTQVCDAPVGRDTDCPHEIFRDIQRLDEGAFKTIEVPGYPGDWVLVIQPFCT